MNKRGPGRPKSPLPMADLHIWLPVHLLTALDTLLLDPVYQRVPYGARSRFIQELLVNDLRARGFNLNPPSSEVQESNT